jgi:magnesium chelatase family protein
MAIALPSKRITINLSPADLPKVGSHFELPIAVTLLCTFEIIPSDVAESYVALGELSLDCALVPVIGALPAAMAASEQNRGLLCPKASGAEAAWVGNVQVIAAQTLGDVVRHFTGQSPIQPAQPGEVTQHNSTKDLTDVKGQERAKRALEIAAAGRHHLMMVGTPGSGKSMLAARLSGILPPLSAMEALETSMIHSLAGLLDAGGISKSRPFREPHHTASMAAIIGGGRNAKPGEASLAHNGVLFMDEFPEFTRTVLETLRQPIETGEVMIARANAHVKYPCKFMLVAAANPCKCGYLTDASRACGRAPNCGEDYMGRISGPLMDRFDLRVDVPPVAYTDLDLPKDGDSSATVRQRVGAAREVQQERYAKMPDMRSNADAAGEALSDVATPTAEDRELLNRAAEQFKLSARGYHRVLRVARNIADLDNSQDVQKPHIAEAISFRLPSQLDG